MPALIVRRPPRGRLSFVAAAVAALAGCGGPLTLAQQVTGEWVGRPEPAHDRVAREWPGGPPDDPANDPEYTAALDAAPTTDLESRPDVVIRMRLGPTGAAELSLDGERARTGRWSLEPLDGGRALLDLSLDPEGAPSDAAEEPRRFEVVFLDAGERIALREQGADRRFGRLMFQRADATP
ncbi:MAG: hypothetical protein AAF805_11095 [Planctomycetota bacterium]